jgi:hypothetical protein
MSEFEAELRRLVPRTGLDREALMYRAGRASARRGWGWPAATALSTAAAVVFALLWLRTPGPSAPGPRVHAPTRAPAVPAPKVAVPPPPAKTPSPSEPPGPSASRPDDGPAWLAGSESARLGEHLLHWGLDGLPPAQPTPAVVPSDSPTNLLRSP